MVGKGAVAGARLSDAMVLATRVAFLGRSLRKASNNARKYREFNSRHFEDG